MVVVGLATALLGPAQVQAAPLGPDVAPSQVTTEASVAPPGFDDTVVLGGLVEPMNVEFARDGRIFVAEKRGIIKVLTAFMIPSLTRSRI